MPSKENYSSKVRDNLEGPIQIGLRLYPTQLEALDAYCKEKGLDRTSAVRVAINQMLDGSGPSAAPAVTSGVSGVDQEARDAMTRLAAKVNLIGASQVKLQERVDALEAKKEEPAPAPFSLDI